MWRDRMKKMKWVVLAFSAVVLTGCLQQQKEALSLCEQQGRNKNPGMSFAKGNAVGQYIRQCMESAGYVWQESARPAKCIDAYVNEANAYCYAPSGFLAGLGNKIEVMTE